jgi:hypothetical protein
MLVRLIIIQRGVARRDHEMLEQSRSCRALPVKGNETGHSSLCGLRSPSGEVIRIFQDLNWNFIIIFECLSGRRFEGLHASVAVARCGDSIGLEVESASVDDAEEGFALIQPVSAEHRSVCQAWQPAELIQHEVSEPVMLRRHGSLREVFAPRPSGRRVGR